MREIWQSVVTTSGAKVYGLLLGMISLVLTARWLGPEGRGILAAVTTWVGLFSILGGMSVGQVAIHRASLRPKESWLGPALGSLGLLAAIVTILGWGVAVLLYVGSEGVAFGNIQGAILFAGFIALPLLVWDQYGSCLLMAVDRINIYNRYQILGSTVALVALFVMLPALHWGVVGAILAVVVGNIITSIGGIRFLWQRAGDTLAIHKDEIQALLKGGVKLHVHGVGMFLLTAVDILILNHHRGAEETGYYQLAMQMMGPMMILPQAAAMVLFGKMTTLGPDEVWKYQRRLIAQIMGFMVFAALFAGFTAPWWIVWFAGAAFAPAVPIFQWLLLGLVGMAFSTLMGCQWIGRGYFWQASILTVVVGLGSLGANVILIPHYGMYGAVGSFLGAYVIVILGNGLLAISCDKKVRENRKLGFCSGGSK